MRKTRQEVGNWNGECLWTTSREFKEGVLISELPRKTRKCMNKCSRSQRLSVQRSIEQPTVCAMQISYKIFQVRQTWLQSSYSCDVSTFCESAWLETTVWLTLLYCLQYMVKIKTVAPSVGGGGEVLQSICSAHTMLLHLLLHLWLQRARKNT